MAAAWLVVAVATAAASQETAPRPAADVLLAPVVVTAPPPVAASSELLIPGKDFELLPQGRPADVLRLVPGLIMSQHQGGGKSEQYMLRGFDADHGTDVALFVDGMPVNLRTHAHGQGYADLHFLIPETINQVDAFKGSYYVEYGDFATAGAIDFVTLDTVPENLVQAAGGSFGTQRYLTLLSPTRDRVKTLFALEAYASDGPFDRPLDYKRLNGFAKASATLGDDVDGSIWAAYLRSSWFGSGQIPARAVRAGLIDRFGSIDNSEGGETERASLNGQVRWKPVSRRPLPSDPGHPVRPPSPRAHAGRELRRAVGLAHGQAGSQPAALDAARDRRPRGRLPLPRSQQPGRGARPAPGRRDAGGAERQGQPGPRSVARHGILRQLRDRLPQQRRPRGGPRPRCPRRAATSSESGPGSCPAWSSPPRTGRSI